MKILRVRRGFTTNSSASSEWVPPQWTPGTKLPPPPGSAIGSGGTSPSGSTTSQTTLSQTAEPVPTPSGGHSNLATNGLAIGGILGVIVLLIAFERLFQRYLRTKPEGGIDDE